MSKITIFKDGKKIYQGEGTITQSSITDELKEEPQRTFTGSFTMKMTRRMRKAWERGVKYEARCRREICLLQDNLHDRIVLARCVNYGDKIPLYLRRKYKCSVNGMMRYMKENPSAGRKKLRP